MHSQDGGKVVLKEYHIPGLTAHICATLPHSYSNVGTFQCNGVISTISSHGHNQVGSLKHLRERLTFKILSVNCKGFVQSRSSPDRDTKPSSHSPKLRAKDSLMEVNITRLGVAHLATMLRSELARSLVTLLKEP
ncbi:hypothetical protein EMCRGX_G031582 [Ephydatia muelleri]